MRKLLFLTVIWSFSLSAFAQNTPRTRSRSTNRSKVTVTAGSKTPSPEPTPPANPAAEKSRFDEAIAAATPTEKIAALQKFLIQYPAGTEKTRANESLTGARAALADAKLEAGDNDAGVALFKLALKESPKPYSDRFFAEVIARIPANLFWRGLQAEALEVASGIEQNVGKNVNQLLVLANFFISIENGAEAKRLADAALGQNAQSAGAFLVTGHANRLNFALEDAAAAYAKALEIEPESLFAKRSLAEMKRALGKSDSAADIYREMLVKNQADQQARTGLVLSLFDAGKKAEAETELAKALEANPKNVVMLTGASYWYGAQKEPVKAADYGQRAIEAEPRYIWSHIALAHALTALGKPLDAERILTNARKYGNFPTLEFEIANARLNSGFYREAALELEKSFSIVDGSVETKLGGRVPKRERSFFELISYERRASIFQPTDAENVENGERLKALLDFSRKLAAPAVDETGLVAAADAFINGDDKMKVHRQLFVANALLQKRLLIPKVLELTKAALGNTDAALDTPLAGAAVMADELYDSRAIAFSRNDYLLVPEVPKQTLSAILRGKVEEIAGWALYKQGNYPDATVRLRRAVSIYPEKSVWMRSGLWHLGSALEADGKNPEALASYIESYKTDKPDVIKYGVVENLYRKVNGTVDGLEAQIGPNPLGAPSTNNAEVVRASPQPEPAASEMPAATQTTAPAASVPTSENRDTATVPETEKTILLKSEPVTEVTSVPVLPVPSVATKPEVQPSDAPIKAESQPLSVPAGNVSVPVEEKKELPKGNPVSDKISETADPPVLSKPEASSSLRSVVPPQPLPDVSPADPPKETPVSQPETTTVTTDPPAAEPEKRITDGLPKTYTVVTTELPSPTVINSRPKISTKRNRPADNVPISEKKSAIKTNPDAARLFEPVIINVPETAVSNATTPVAPADGRARTATGMDVRADTPATCKISVSDESVSVINGGGSIGVLITVEADDDVDVTASSSSPENIEVKADPENSAQTKRRFYVIKSIGTELGMYDVVFSARCGKATVAVKVR